MKEITVLPCRDSKRKIKVPEITLFKYLPELKEELDNKMISKEEALDYLKKNEDDGLIFQLSNSQEMDFVCSCCSCCCGGLISLKSIPNPADYTSSNYQAVIDGELCSGCGTCIERCQMDAITLVDDIANLNPQRCIGCGNCIIGCPEDAITLVAKGEPSIPPLTTSDLFRNIAEARKEQDSL